MGQISAIINFNRDIAQEMWRIKAMAEMQGEGLNRKYHSSEHSLFAAIQSEAEDHILESVIDGISYRISLNGVLYNRNELIDQLLKLNANLTLKNNVEVILNLYHLYQHRSFNLLNGVFVIIIEHEQKVIVARDQMGIKPLYYAQKNDGEWLISSQIKAILKEGSIIPTLNNQSFLELFALGPSMSEGNTVYKNIHMLEMGHYMVLQSNRSIMQRYHHLENRIHKENFEETSNHVRSLLSDAIMLQSPQKKFGSFLSGGLDSSIISAIAAKSHPDLVTFSLDYEGNEEHFKGYSYQSILDQPYIESMIAMYNTNHHSLTISQQKLASLLNEAWIARDMPGMADIDSSLLWLCKQSKQYTDIVLSGECADEIFGGYPWYYRQDLVELQSFPWLQSLNQRTNLLSDHFKNYDFVGYRDECYRKTLEEIPRLSSDSPQDRRIKEITYLTMHWFMQTLILRQDAQATRANLEMRVPFADIRIVDYLWNVPWSMKFNNKMEKGLLRNAFVDVLPSEVLNRKKNPFPKTHNPQYVEIVKNMLRANLKKDDSILHLLFNPKQLKLLIDSAGESFTVPWFGQLMMGPQLLAYLYQIDQWIKTERVKIEI